jgi:putative DeoR family transcriptional regulator (stage III sporulation protein D)
MINNRCTIRQAARVFGVSKSTIHKDLTDRIGLVCDTNRTKKVQFVLAFNKAQRHIRGGLATQMKYKFNN